MLPRTERVSWRAPAERGSRQRRARGRAAAEPLGADRGRRPAALPARARRPRGSTGRRSRAAPGCSSAGCAPTATAARWSCSTPAAPGPTEQLDAAVRAAASLTLELGAPDGCGLLLPGERRPLARRARPGRAGPPPTPAWRWSRAARTRRRRCSRPGAARPARCSTSRAAPLDAAAGRRRGVGARTGRARAARGAGGAAVAGRRASRSPDAAGSCVGRAAGGGRRAERGGVSTGCTAGRACSAPRGAGRPRPRARRRAPRRERPLRPAGDVRRARAVRRAALGDAAEPAPAWRLLGLLALVAWRVAPGA